VAIPQIYKEHGTTYHADTCEPLVSAAQAGRVATEILARGSYPGRRLGKSELPGICSIGYWDAVGRQGWGLDWHRNEGVEITFLETGSMPFAVGSQEYVLQPNDLTITRPWQVHRVGNPNVGAGRLHWVILDVNVRRPNQAWHWPKWVVMTKNDLKELTRILRHNEVPVWPATAEIRECFKQIGRAVKADRSGSNISLLSARLNELFVLLLEMLRQQSVRLNPALSSTRRTVELFLTDLRNNLDNLAQQWTLSSMAKQCGLAVTYFVYYCRQLTNMAPMHYLNRCRIEAASKMLAENPQMKVTDVAFACGFNSSQYFATVFRRYVGSSPKSFRTQHPGGRSITMA
jgi:AraC family 4-hydroxyphenylacetate 3-monooxygenase operon regulatory protein